MSIRLHKSLVAAGACAAVLLHGAASANVLFSGSGSWAGDAAFSSLSAPNATWSFLFVLPDTVSAGASSAISSFSYRLNGVSVVTPATSIGFYSAADGGMFDITFGSSATSFSLYGDAVLSGSALVPGNYAVFAGIDGGQATGQGSVSLAQVAAPVPEPSTWALFALGLAGVGVAVRGRTRQPAASTCP